VLRGDDIRRRAGKEKVTSTKTGGTGKRQAGERCRIELDFKTKKPVEAPDARTPKERAQRYSVLHPREGGGGNLSNTGL